MLEFSSSQAAADKADAPCVVVGVFDQSFTGAAAAIDQASGGALTRLRDAGDLSCKAGTTLVLHGVSGVSAARVLLVGLGAKADFDGLGLQRACIEAGKALKNLPVESATVFLPELEVRGHDAAWRVRTCALALDHANYRYTATVKPSGKGARLQRVELAGADEKTLGQARAMARGVEFARELGCLPPNLCTPAYLAERARGIADSHDGVTLEVLERDRMRELGMGALLAVAQGSANPPKLIVLQYRGGKGGDKPFALVGKGVTFDTGGMNLKPTGSMEEMKYDMCGAAGVLGAFLAAVEMKLPINLVCLVPAVENMPDGGSYRPSDVLTTLSGLTVEVLNTDAEGRLILCDALAYAKRFEPQAIVDAATLTGACVIALGKHATGLFSADDKLANELLDAGNATLDRAWRMPLWDDYRSQLESAFADIANIGGKSAGAITAACFLSRFTEGTPWAHLDVAGTAWDEGRKGYATGRPVPLLTQWLMSKAG
ncbi:MAG TPA: leucyl aminopeptidase [Rhodanobacteraceae bacterium]|nr:leucyl aminopeptidase [Rhodanobacteraceae bacterium]